MSEFLGFTEVTAAIVVALGLALGLNWLGLTAFMRLMPAQRHVPSHTEEKR